MKINEFLNEAPRVDPATMKARQDRSAAFRQPVTQAPQQTTQAPQQTTQAPPQTTQAPQQTTQAPPQSAPTAQQTATPKLAVADPRLNPAIQPGTVYKGDPNNPNYQKNLDAAAAQDAASGRAPQQTTKQNIPGIPNPAFGNAENDVDLKPGNYKPMPSTSGGFWHAAAKSLGFDKTAAGLDAAKAADYRQGEQEKIRTPDVSGWTPAKRAALKKQLQKSLNNKVAR